MCSLKNALHVKNFIRKYDLPFHPSTLSSSSVSSVIIPEKSEPEMFFQIWCFQRKILIFLFKMCFCHNDCALIESLLLSLLLQPLGTMPKSWLTLSKSVACLLKMFVHNKHSKWLNLWKINFSTFGLYVIELMKD
jgi:hypothetical protein